MPIRKLSQMETRLVGCTLAALLLTIAGTGYSRAATCRVTADAATGGTGIDWKNSPMTLQDALGNVSCTEVWVKAGVYTPGLVASDSFVIAPGVSLYGGFAGTETLREQRDPAVNVSVLSGDIGGDDLDNDGNHIDETSADIVGDNSDYVVSMIEVDGAQITTSTQVDGFVITGGANGYVGFGGGLICLANGAGSQCSPIINNVMFSGNKASAYGGAMGISAADGGITSPVLSNVTFRGNFSYSGGGALYIHSIVGGINNCVFYNVTFSDNETQSTGSGGALGGAIRIDHADASIYHATFHGNNAHSGGAIFAEFASIELHDTILWGNTAFANAQLAIQSNTASIIDHSVIQDSFPGGTWDGSLGIDAGGNSAADPQLGALGNYGGATSTFLLGAGSSAIDAGSDRCRSVSLLSTDQRGMSRPQGARCDIGAVEMPYATNLTIGNVNGWGSVSAASVPAPLSGGITDCDGASNCSADYAQNSVVQLTAMPKPFALFVGWSGDCSGTDIHFNVRMDTAKSCNAVFNPEAALVVTMENGHRFARIGDWLTYVISISNYQDTDIGALTVSDVLPTQLDATTATWYCIPDNDNSTCAFYGAGYGTGNLLDTSLLPAYSSISYVLTAQVRGGGDDRIRNMIAVSDSDGTITTDLTTTIAIFRSGFDGGDGTQ